MHLETGALRRNQRGGSVEENGPVELVFSVQPGAVARLTVLIVNISV